MSKVLDFTNPQMVKVKDASAAVERSLLIKNKLQESGKVSKMTMESLVSLADVEEDKNYPVASYTTSDSEIGHTAAVKTATKVTNKTLTELVKEFYQTSNQFKEMLCDFKSQFPFPNLKANLTYIQEVNESVVNDALEKADQIEPDQYEFEFIQSILPDGTVFVNAGRLKDHLPDSFEVVCDLIKRLSTNVELEEGQLGSYLSSVSNKLTYRSLSDMVNDWVISFDRAESMDLKVLSCNTHVMANFIKVTGDILSAVNSCQKVVESFMLDDTLNVDALEVKIHDDVLVKKLSTVINKSLTHMQSLGLFIEYYLELFQIYDTFYEKIRMKLA